MDEEEQIPAISLSRVLKWRTKLKELLTAKYVGQTISDSTLTALVSDLTAMLGKSVKDTLPHTISKVDPDVVRPAVHKTVEYELIGNVLDVPLTNHFVARVAGNVERLRSGLAVTPWQEQKEYEWVLTNIREAVFYRTPKKKIPGASLDMYILTGTPADLTTSQFFTEYGLVNLAEKLRMRKRRDESPMHYREVVQGFMLLKLKPGTELTVDRWQERESLNKRNKLRAKYRSRYKKHCPRESKWPCHFCPVGYEVCPYGTHKADYIEGPCSGTHTGWFHPRQKRGKCLYCTAKYWLRTH